MQYDEIFEKVISGWRKPRAALSLLSGLGHLSSYKLRMIKHIFCKKEFDQRKTFIDIFSKNVKKNANKKALVDELGSYTYRELDELSNGVAVRLIGQGIGTGDIVPILMSRSKAFVAAFIGVMKSGAAFVPLDINYPEERIKSIEKSVDAKIVIDDEWMKAVSPSDEFINNSRPDDMAFIIFTSGSTGKPKGVIHNHRSVLTMACATKRSCGIDSKYKYATFLGFHFIGGMDDTFTYLYSECTNYIVPETTRKDPYSFSEWLNGNNIEAININPSMGRLLLEQFHTNLKKISFVGEKISSIPESSIIISQKYGCSEFVPASFNSLIQHNDYGNIGQTADGVKAFIVTDDNLIAKNGETGELCLVGSQMASGYWKMPELTAEKFVHCPFLPGDVKMYKTGDLARYREDGNIELVGRKDFQIKIRGFRIEPGEIENMAVKFDGIDTVVVVAKEMGNEKQLVLYYTSNSQIDETKLKDFLARYLADYMVPNFYVHLDEMPRNANGKIYRCFLPGHEKLGRHYEEAKGEKNPTEMMIFKLVADILGTKNFGVTDNFYSLGFSSISGISLLASLRDLGYNVSAFDLLQLNTVKKLATFIDHH